ncbi:DUF7693 family protein [Burkholderia cenocepacia]|uniref:DUF7693 domain-containing protein n=1 Tax=Burkholderia cenocepacia TaxID=95486 RepID=A0A6B2MPZ3_9BURK|nr:hypothetical protein [Burkholderia cenocepacia]NDV77106.1 hypothetical protein [Burkholderia cenocepacia]
MIAADEVTQVLRKALNGDVSVQLVGNMHWHAVGSGNVEFAFGDWKVTFFNDAGELDYVDHAIAPDGRRASFDDWAGPTGHGRDPIDLLSTWEQCELSDLLERLSPSA